MNRSEIIRAVSEKADISKIKAGFVVDAITDAVTQALVAGMMSPSSDSARLKSEPAPSEQAAIPKPARR